MRYVIELWYRTKCMCTFYLPPHVEKNSPISSLRCFRVLMRCPCQETFGGQYWQLNHDPWFQDISMRFGARVLCSSILLPPFPMDSLAHCWLGILYGFISISWYCSSLIVLLAVHLVNTSPELHTHYKDSRAIHRHPSTPMWLLWYSHTFSLWKRFIPDRQFFSSCSNGVFQDVLNLCDWATLSVPLGRIIGGLWHNFYFFLGDLICGLTFSTAVRHQTLLSRLSCVCIDYWDRMWVGPS